MTATMKSSRCIGILTAIPDVELLAVKRVFGISENQVPKVFAGEKYWNTTVALPCGETATVFISCSGRSGNTEIQLPTDRLIRFCNPEMVVFVGIACGLRKFHQLGDVTTSDLVWAYEYVKTSEDRPLDRSRAKSTPSFIQSDVAFFQYWKDWQRYFRAAEKKTPRKLRPRSEPKPSIHASNWIASGDKVLGGGELQLLNDKHNLIRVGEMEGYGFAVACEARRLPVPWFVVRGISDYGDPTKDNTDPSTPDPLKDEYHWAAANAAAAFMRAFLERAYTPRLAEAQIRVYSSDHDPEFKAELRRMLGEAQATVVICGMGLKFLKNDTELVSKVAEALNASAQLRVEVIAANPDNPGILARVDEERRASEEIGRQYRTEWPKIYAKSIEGAFDRVISGAARDRFSFECADLCPTLSVVKIDDTYFFSPFGTANVRGPESPWLMTLPGTAPTLTSFLDNVIEYFRRRAISRVCEASRER